MIKPRDWKLLLILLFPVISFGETGFSLRAQRVMEEGLLANEALIEFLQSRSCEFGLIKGCAKPLSAKDIHRLKQLFRDLHSWKRVTFEEILPLADHIKGRKFTLKEGRHYIREEAKQVEITLEKGSIHSLNYLKSIQIATASGLVMYDSFFRLSELLSRAKKIREVIEYDMGPEGGLLRDTFSVALKDSLWRGVRNNLLFTEAASSFMGKTFTAFEQYSEYSFTGSRMKEGDHSYRLRGVLLMNRVLAETDFIAAIEKIMGKLSEIFGNAVGKIQIREGKLKKLAQLPEVMTNLKKKLKPLDILFEKTPFRLTDRFIPGYYGHVAIWLGTPEELMRMKVQYRGKQISLLDHPKVLPHLEKLSQGRLLVEALREPGVTMNRLEGFMDVDDLLAVTPTEVRDPGEVVLQALEQVGKPYDFNFDVESERSIVCSELIYQVYRDYDWPLSQSFGRFTISPDHVAWKAVDTCMQPVFMFHDGREIKTSLRQELRRLLERRGGISYTPVGDCR